MKDEKVGVEGLISRNFERGKKLFTEVKCLTCHTFAGTGRSSSARRSRPRGRVLGPSIFSCRFSNLTRSSPTPIGKKSSSWTMAESSRAWSRRTTMKSRSPRTCLQPEKKVVVKAEKVVNMEDSPISPMPAGLIDNLKPRASLDLIAYAISQDDPEDEMFAPAREKEIILYLFSWRMLSCAFTSSVRRWPRPASPCWP